MSPDQGSLFFGCAAVALNLGWAWYSLGTPERHMAFAFLGYAIASVAFLWPVLRRLLA
jgi:membrane protein implicated in regulation of membrane protease activity